MIPLQTEFTNLIEPNTLTTGFALIIFLIMGIFAYIAIKLRHALLMLMWGSTVILFAMIIVVNLEFIWFWIAVMAMASITVLAGVFRFFIDPSFT